MIVNRDKFQAIDVKKTADSYALNVNNQTIDSENCANKIGNTLSSNKHISTLCKKSSNQLNAIR